MLSSFFLEVIWRPRGWHVLVPSRRHLRLACPVMSCPKPRAPATTCPAALLPCIVLPPRDLVAASETCCRSIIPCRRQSTDQNKPVNLSINPSINYSKHSSSLSLFHSHFFLFPTWGFTSFIRFQSFIHPHHKIANTSRRGGQKTSYHRHQCNMSLLFSLSCETQCRGEEQKSAPITQGLHIQGERRKIALRCGAHHASWISFGLGSVDYDLLIVES